MIPVYLYILRHMVWWVPKCLSFSAVFLHENRTWWLEVQGELPGGVCSGLSCQGAYKFICRGAPWVEVGLVSQQWLNASVVKWKGKAHQGSLWPKGTAFLHPEKTPRGRCHFQPSWAAQGRASGRRGLRAACQHPRLPWQWGSRDHWHSMSLRLGRRRDGRRVEVICFHFFWLVFLWHLSKCEMQSD